MPLIDSLLFYYATELTIAYEVEFARIGGR
jgi:hypothetical protein